MDLQSCLIVKNVELFDKVPSGKRFRESKSFYNIQEESPHPKADLVLASFLLLNQCSFHSYSQNKQPDCSVDRKWRYDNTLTMPLTAPRIHVYLDLICIQSHGNS
ncbi:MAG: hypothetical protein CL912_01840 [Deltaproteobacteria bacterium]|nr:hypothetical protein [Deltaproteobacteria bacterium]